MVASIDDLRRRCLCSRRESLRRSVIWLVAFGALRLGEGFNDRASRGTTRPSNKGMKQTKPSILELRSLSPVLGRLGGGA